MLGLARLAMKSPIHTGILAALLSFLPLGFVFSAPIVALATLRHGITVGSRILGFGLLGGIAGYVVFGMPFQLITLPLVTIFAMLLRATTRWSWVLIASTLVGVIMLPSIEFIFSGVLDEIAENWMEMIAQLDTQAVQSESVQSDDIRQIYKFGISGGVAQMAVLFLLWGRYWQAALYNPGGLRKELHSFQFTKAEVLVLGGAAGLSVAFTSIWALMLFGFPFIFAGLALIHGIVAKVNLSGQWLVFLYIALVILNQFIVLLLLVLVLVDLAIDIRGRLPEKPKTDNE